MAQSDNARQHLLPRARNGCCGEHASVRRRSCNGRSGSGFRRRVLKAIRSSRLAEGLPYPLGATWDGLGVNFALFSANATKVELCLFEEGGRREVERITLPEYTDEVWHGYLPDARPGTVYGYRVHGPVRACGGASLQSQQAADRSLCPADDRPYRLEPCTVRLQGRDRRRPHVRRARQRTLHDESLRDRPGLHLGPRPAAARAVGEHHPLRSACARPDQALSRAGGEPARHLRGAGERRDHRLPDIARHHRRRAAAGPHLRRRQPSARQGPEELLGLQHDRLLRAGPALRGQRRLRLRRVQGDGGPSARCRARADPRRGLQPHRRGQRARSYPVLQGHRQRLLLQAGARPAALHQRHRHRQHGEPQQQPRAADGDGQPALLGQRHARRRLPLRPRHHPGARAARLPRGRPFPRRLPPGPDAQPGQADRRAVGHRARRLPGRPFLARLGGMERPLSRHGAGLLARRRRASCPSSRRASPPRPTCSPSAAASRGPRSTSWPRTTASR